MSRSQNVRHLTSSGTPRHDFMSRCLRVVTHELTEGELFLMNTGLPKKRNMFSEVKNVIGKLQKRTTPVFWQYIFEVSCPIILFLSFIDSRGIYDNNTVVTDYLCFIKRSSNHV